MLEKRFLRRREKVLVSAREIKQGGSLQSVLTGGRAEWILQKDLETVKNAEYLHCCSSDFIVIKGTRPLLQKICKSFRLCTDYLDSV